MCGVQHFGLSEKSWGLCSVLEGSPTIVCVRSFWKRLWSCLWTWWPFPHELSCLYYLILLAVSNIVTGFLYSSAHVWWWYCGIIVPWLPVQQGVQCSQRNCFATASDFPGSLLPAFCFLRSVMKKVSTGCLNFFPEGFLWWPSFLLLYRVGNT